MPNLLPPHWSWVKLGDVCEPPQYGYTTSASNNGDLKFLRTTDITSGQIDWDLVPFCKVNPKEIDKYLLKENDVVISRAGSVGYSLLLSKPQRAVFASYLIRFRPKTNPKFFALFLQSPQYWSQISEKKLGIAVPNVNAKILMNINFPLPPLPEQKKIVEKIEELFSQLDSGVASLKKAKEQIRLYRQSVLAAAFSGRLTGQVGGKQLATGKSEISKAAEPKTLYSNQLPDGWKWVKLGEIIKVSSGKGLTSANMFTDGLYPVYGGNGVSGYYNDFLFEEPRLIIGRVGAKCGVIYITKPKSWVTDNALIVDFTSNDVEMKFLYHCLDYHNLNKLSVSTAQPVISGAKIYPYEIMLPPLKQQTKIVEEIEKRLSEADNLEKAIDESLAKSKTLRQSILKQAFEGRLV